MILLAGVTDLVQIVTSAAVACHIQTSWVDNLAGAITPNRTNTIVSTATTTTIVGSPAASTARSVRYIGVTAVGGAQTVSVRHTDGTNVVKLYEAALQSGEWAVFTGDAGWQTFSSLGALKTTSSTSGAFTIVNVRDYGAKGDGSTDDKSAIQQAINQAGAMGVSGRGVDVFFPAGVYAVSGPITCTFNNVMLRGAGWQSTIIYCTITTGDVVQFGDGAATVAGCGLMNMSVWKSAAATTGSSININKMNDVLLQNFVVNNCFIGINIQGASIKVWVDQGEINNATSATGHGIQVTNGAAGDTYIRAIVMSNNPGSKPASGINLVQTGHCAIINCNITSANKGLLVNPSTSQDVSYLFIEHSLFDSCGSHGAHFNGTTAASSRIRNVMCIDSWFSGSTTSGVGIEFTASGGAIVDALSFIGCRLLNNTNHGALINAGPLNISFTDCTVSGNGTALTNSFDGINIAANASNISILNCGLGQQGTAGSTQRFAVNIAAGTSANVQILSNQCAPNASVGTHGYINSGVLTGGGNLIDGNNPQTSVSMCAATVAASGGINTTETVISPALRFAANGLRAQSTILFKVAGSCTITTAAAVPTFRVRLGTAGTTADGVIMTFTLPTSGGVGTSAFVLEATITCRTIGASGTFQGDISVAQASATLGLLATNCTAVAGTAATGSTQAINFITLTFQGASANVTCTFQKVTTQVVVS